MTDRFLGIDLGTSSVKVLVVDLGGGIAGNGTAEYATRQPEPGHAEQHPEDWWAATVTATKRALTAAGPETARQIAGIGLSGQMHGTVLLGPADQVLAPAIIWSDTRAVAEVREVTDLIGADRLIALTGSPLATGFQAATIRWFQRHHPHLWRGVRRVLLPKDYLRWLMTGTHATDPSDGSGTLLLDVHRRDWSAEILAALGVSPDVLPPVLPSAAAAGVLRPAAAADLGLSAGIPVATGGGDAPCAALGAGSIAPDALLLTLSTGAQVLQPSTSVWTDGRGRLHSFCNVLEPGDDRAGWYTMGATLAAGLALRWLRDNIFGLGGHATIPQMMAWAETAPPGANGLIFLPYLAGERTPHMDPQARAVYLGLTARHGRAELVRAAIEGAAFAAYDAYLALRDIGADPKKVVIAGGGARSPLWRQIVADVFALPVQPLATADQSAVGAAVLGAAAAGAVEPGTAARRWAKHGDEVAPDGSTHNRYLDLFAIYRDAYAKHREDFATLAAFG